MGSHYGEDDTSEAGTCCHHAKGCAALLEEPCCNSVCSGVENAVKTERRADSLSKDELPVFFAKTGHHDTEDVEKGTKEQEISWTVVIVNKADDGSREKHDKYLAR